METSVAAPNNYAAVSILRAAPLGEIVAMVFGTPLSQIDVDAQTPTTESYFAADEAGNLTVGADLTAAPAIIRCVSTAGTIVDITMV